MDSVGREAVPGKAYTIEAVPETDTGGVVEYTEALREPWLRNSANCIRNFGRRMPFGWATNQGGHRNGDSDCLVKTQDSANTKVDV